MPSFPKTPAGQERRRVFNEARREQYVEARLLGIEPRDAGHVYNAADFQRKVPAIMMQRTPAPESVRESPLMHRQRVPDYRGNFELYYSTYVKVRVNTIDENGHRSRRFMTAAFDSLETPTRQAIADRIRSILDQNAGRYPVEVVGFTVLGVDKAPDRTRDPGGPRTIREQHPPVPNPGAEQPDT